MISLTTAKLLLFIALCLGPKYSGGDHAIQITSTNSYIVWTERAGEWSATQKGFASNAWPVHGIDVSKDDLAQLGKKNAQIARDISGHDWPHDSTLYLENGDVVEKQGSNKIFYTINAGGDNQRVFTIQATENGSPL